MKITLVRHAPPKLVGVCYGNYDMPVEPLESKNVIEKWQALQEHWLVDSVNCSLYTSTSLRCLEVARSLQEISHAQKFEVLDQIKEMHFGKWEGIPWNELPRKETEVWTNNWQTMAPPSGESFVELCFRIEMFWKQLIKNNKSAWVVTHAGPMRILLALSKEQKPADFIATPIEYLTPYTIEWSV